MGGRKRGLRGWAGGTAERARCGGVDGSRAGWAWGVLRACGRDSPGRGWIS